MLVSKQHSLSPRVPNLIRTHVAVKLDDSVCVCFAVKKESRNWSCDLPAALAMGKDTELFKAAQSGNTGALEKAFANHLKRISGQSSHHGR